MQSFWELKCLEYNYRIRMSSPEEGVSDTERFIRQMFSQMGSIEEEKLVERVRYCIGELPELEVNYITLKYKDSLSDNKIAIHLGISETQRRNIDTHVTGHLLCLQTANIILYGIEEGLNKNSILKEEMTSKYSHGDMSYTVEERALLSVKDSSLEQNARRALLRASVEDFSQLFNKNFSEIVRLKGIGVNHAKTIKDYLHKEYGIVIRS